MRITESTKKAIMSSPVGSGKPEQGGVLFSSDGGYTIDLFIYDRKGSTTGGTYSPCVEFVNEQIKYYNDRGYYFIGCIHSHPKGFTSLSMGKCLNGGHTSSDQEAIIKLLTAMKGTKRLYFPVVQSSYYGEFSMRMFFGERDRYGRIEIYEDKQVQIIADNHNAMAREEIQGVVPIKNYSHSTVILIGAGNGIEIAEWLVRNGITKFILIDGTRYQLSDIASIALYDNVGGYKADAVARQIKAINPMANVKIIRQYIDDEIDLKKFKCWLDNIDRKRSIVVYCNSVADDFSRTQMLCSKTGILLVRGLMNSTYCQNTALITIESYDYWAHSRAERTQKTEYVTYYPGFQNPVNLALLKTIYNFFTNPADKKERQESAKPAVNEMPVKAKYEPLYTREEIERKKVVIIGCGGSRSYAENLARSGIKHFVLIDADTYGKTNLQTQMAYADEMDRFKADVIADKIKLINPEAEITVVNKMLDEEMTDEQFIEYIGIDWAVRPNDVLIAACTDNVIAQFRCSRLSLKYGFPFLMAGIYPAGRILEIVFFHPETTTVCPRCILNKRLNANLSLAKRPEPARSDGTSVFITELLNSYKGYISLGLLLYHSETADKRYSEFLDDNKWGTPKRRSKKDRNLIFITMDSKLQEHTGREAYVKFDNWGRKLGSNYQFGVSLFRKQSPLKKCPDCGGKGKPLITIKGKMEDTRTGLYPKEEI